VVHGLDPQRVDSAEGAANVADDVLQLRREQDVGIGTMNTALTKRPNRASFTNLPPEDAPFT
jgi:hypothetical protein